MNIKVNIGCRNLIYALIIVILTSCGTPGIINKKHKDMDDITVTDQIAIVDYWKEIDKYTISYSIPNTIDSRITAIVETSINLPESLKKSGEKIIFSGKITKKTNQPLPRMGGEEIFTIIELNSIKSIK